MPDDATAQPQSVSFKLFLRRVPRINITYKDKDDLFDQFKRKIAKYGISLRNLYCIDDDNEPTGAGRVPAVRNLRTKNPSRGPQSVDIVVDTVPVPVPDHAVGVTLVDDVPTQEMAQEDATVFANLMATVDTITCPCISHSDGSITL
ncbi:unnamed protein product [Nippostrongylus brasiliensis]|uniref:DWNN domain-containing protein n=1 Tax=Nippostrongylus brasiliensis TaxID=27835 RepID=A0A0N4XCU8_NIPBR|nr:unnamed protein product [Nippostrongylus brasiliensis]